MNSLFVLIRWAGVSTLSIVTQEEGKIPDNSLVIGKIAAVHHKDLRNREKAYEGKILGFGTFEEMLKLKANFKDFDESNDPASPPKPNLTASGLKRQRKANLYYAENFIQPNKLSSVLDSAEKYASKSEVKKKKELQKEEKKEVEKVKKNLFSDMMNVEPLYSVLTTSNSVLDYNYKSPEIDNVESEYIPLEQSKVIEQQSTMMHQSTYDQHFQPQFQPQAYQFQPQYMHHPFNTLFQPQMQFQQNQQWNNEFTSNRICNMPTSFPQIGTQHHSSGTFSDKHDKEKGLCTKDDVDGEKQQLIEGGLPIRNEKINNDGITIDLNENHEEDEGSCSKGDVGDEEQQTIEGGLPITNEKNSDDWITSDFTENHDEKSSQNRNAHEELRMGLSLVYGVLSKARTKQELSSGLCDVIGQLGQNVTVPVDKSNIFKPVFNTEKVKLVELIHGSGTMVSKTEKEITLKDANGDQKLLVTGALDMIYGKGIASMSALGTRKENGIDEKVYKTVYLFATHNKDENNEDLTKTEYNKIINDHCSSVRNKKKGKTAQEKQKTTGEKKTSEPLTKPKTLAQINRQKKMKALSELRKKEKIARKSKFLQ